IASRRKRATTKPVTHALSDQKRRGHLLSESFNARFKFLELLVGQFLEAGYAGACPFLQIISAKGVPPASWGDRDDVQAEDEGSHRGKGCFDAPQGGPRQCPRASCQARGVRGQ